MLLLNVDSASLLSFRLSLHEWLLGGLRKADGQKGLVYLCCNKTQHEGLLVYKAETQQPFCNRQAGRPEAGR